MKSTLGRVSTSLLLALAFLCRATYISPVSALRCSNYRSQRTLSLSSSRADSDGGGGAPLSTGESYGDWAAPRPPAIQYPQATNPNGSKNEDSEAVSTLTSLASSQNPRGYSDRLGDSQSYEKTRRRAPKFVSDGGMMFELQKASSILTRPEERKISNEASDPMWLKVSEQKSTPDDTTGFNSVPVSPRRDDEYMLWDHQTPPSGDYRWREAYLNPSVSVESVIDETTVVLKPRQPTLLWEQRESDFLPRY